jgi:hypothetical protein
MCADTDKQVYAYAHGQEDIRMNEHTDVAAHEHSVNPANHGKGKPTRKGKSKAADTLKSKRSVNLSMPVEDYERFALHALRLTGGNISELVCKLGREHLREFHITRTAKGVSGPNE